MKFERGKSVSGATGIYTDSRCDELIGGLWMCWIVSRYRIVEQGR